MLMKKFINTSTYKIIYKIIRTLIMSAYIIVLIIIVLEDSVDLSTL